MCCSFRVALLLLASSACLPALCACEDTLYASSTYVRQSLTALRQQIWQLPKSAGNPNGGSTICQRRVSNGRHFLLVAMPLESQLNEVEIRMFRSNGENVTTMAALSSQMTEEISKKLAQYCNCPDEALPPTNESLIWKSMDQWMSTDGRVFRASVKKLEPISHVVFQFSTEPAIEDVNFGLFFMKKPSQAIWTYMAVVSTMSMGLSLVLLVLLITIVWKSYKAECCPQTSKSGPSGPAGHNFYCDSGRERETFPPDTGIYMS